MKLKITYFNARGRAEIPRLICAYGKIPFEDHRIEGQDWPALKPTTPYGSIPILEVDGVVVGQTVAINRFLAQKAGIEGHGEVEKALAEGIMVYINDIISESGKVLGAKSEDEKKRIITEFLADSGKVFCSRMESRLEKNGGKYLVGKSLTYADIGVAYMISVFEGIGGGDLVSSFHHLKKHKEAVFGLDRIKKWIETRPENAF